MLFALCGSWEALDGCKILLRGVGMICPPGKHHSENFQKSLKIAKRKQILEMFGSGTLLTGGVINRRGGLCGRCTHLENIKSTNHPTPRPPMPITHHASTPLLAQGRQPIMPPSCTPALLIHPAHTLLHPRAKCNFPFAFICFWKDMDLNMTKYCSNMPKTN